MKKSNLKRRYEEGEYPIYDKAFADYYNKSHVLNKHRQRNLSDPQTAYRQNWDNDPKFAKINLLEIEGNEQGEYYRNGDRKIANFVVAKEEYKKVKAEFKDWAKKQVANGNVLNPPKDENRNYPKYLLSPKLKAEALLDITKQEIKVLTDYISQHELSEEAEHKSWILKGPNRIPTGPMGSVGLKPAEPGAGVSRRTGKLATVDNQKVSRKNGVPYIDEPDSPYDRMPVVHYKKMVEKWKQKNAIDREQLAERRKQYNEQLKEELDRNVYVSTTDFTEMLLGEREWPDGVKPKDSVWPDWPKWPKFAKPINELELETA